MNRIISTTALALTLVLAQPVIANSAEIKVWTARALATVLAEIGPQFERTTGHNLNISTGLSTEFVRRANAGESFDVMINRSGPVASGIKDGKIIAATRTSIARSGIGVEVRAGARKPDISSVEAFKRALLEAKSIAYLRGCLKSSKMSAFDRWRALLRGISTTLSRLKSMMPIFIWTLLMQPRGLFKQPLRPTVSL